VQVILLSNGKYLFGENPNHRAGAALPGHPSRRAAAVPHHCAQKLGTVAADEHRARDKVLACIESAEECRRDAHRTHRVDAQRHR
jgi:hypothetical protein